MRRIDLNCDMGEGIGQDHLIMPWVTSANIACGFHAGSSEIMKKTVDLALRHGVKIGAHPSFRDKTNFGRVEMKLSPDKVYAIVLEQIIKLDLIAKTRGASLYHVKPHGALYNIAARDEKTAEAIVNAIRDFDDALVLYGLSGSQLTACAAAMNLRYASEVFADRTYQDDGSLTPRSQAGALINDEKRSIRQVRMMILEKKVIAVSGKEVPIQADTVCIHGDGAHAAAFAEKLYFATQPHNLA